MKTIQDVPIWYDGSIKNATLLDVSVSDVYLGTSATIKFRLYSAFANDTNYPDKQLSSGILVMEGQDYADWGENDDYVWSWVASKLNIVII